MKNQPTRAIGSNATHPMEQLLRLAIPPVGDPAESPRDLWPAVKRGLHAHTALSPAMPHVPWFDWALGCGLAALLVFFPAWIPVLLYCL